MDTNFIEYKVRNNMKNFIDYDKLERLSEADKDVPFYKKIIKLQEEAGEVAQEFLAWDDKQNGIKTNSSKSAEGTIEAIIEEVCDTTNICIDILNFIEMKHPELSEYISTRFQQKVDKCESKIVANKILEEYKNASDERNDKIISDKMKTIIQEDIQIKSCSNCKFLDTTVTLMSYPPKFSCKSNESGKYSVKCDKIDTFKCNFHEFK